MSSPLLTVAVFGLGAIIGSFLNVCIYRLPLKQSVVWPGSACPACGKRLSWKENIPLLSFLWLKGRCRGCQAPIPLRYPLVECLNGLGYVAVVWKFGYSAPALVYAVFFSLLLIISWIDMDHYIIPDVLTLPGIGMGLLCAAVILPIGIMSAAAGVLLGGGILWGLAVLSPYLFGKEGMGGGDIKLLAMIGAFLGWQSVLMTLMMAAVVGSVVGIGLMLFKLMDRDHYIPFGPFLALGAVFSLLFQSQALHWYMEVLW